MKIGKLRHLVTLQSYSTTQNAYGEVVKIWVNYTQCWASIAPISSRNYESGQQEDVEITHQIYIRYNGTISTKDRIVYGTDTYEVQEVINFDTRQTYQIIKAIQIYPSSEAANIDYAGHTSEILDYCDVVEGYLFLDVDEWLLYERNDTAYDEEETDFTVFFKTPKSVGSDAKKTTLTTTIDADVSWDNELLALVQVPKDITISSVSAIVSGSGTLTFTLQEKLTLSGTPDTILASDMVATTSRTTTTLLTNSTISQNSYLCFVTSTSAETGVVNSLTITIRYY